MQAIKPALRTMKSGASCPVTFDWGVQGAEFGHVSGPNVDTLYQCPGVIVGSTVAGVFAGCLQRRWMRRQCLVKAKVGAVMQQLQRVKSQEPRVKGQESRVKNQVLLRWGVAGCHCSLPGSRGWAYRVARNA